MAKFEGVKRITSEDFESKDQALISKLASPLNNVLEFVARAFNKNIGWSDNLNCDLRVIELNVNASGLPTPEVTFKSNLKGTCKGIYIEKLENLTNPGTYPTSAPFISFSEDNFQISINHITGLTSGNKYRISLVCRGG